MSLGSRKTRAMVFICARLKFQEASHFFVVLNNKMSLYLTTQTTGEREPCYRWHSQHQLVTHYTPNKHLCAAAAAGTRLLSLPRIGTKEFW